MILPHIVTYTIFIASVAASPRAFAKREDNIKCDIQSCIASYTAGSAQCNSGYERSRLEAPGYPLGSYCERSCTESEQKSCATERCEYWEKECNGTPRGEGTCKNALDWCGGPVAMSQLICKDKIMGQSVKYEKDACLPKGKTLDSRPYSKASKGLGGMFPAVVRDEAKYNWVEYVCWPVSYLDAKNMATDLIAKYEGCKIGIDENDNDQGRDFVRVGCKNTPEAEWAQVGEFLKERCKKAEPWNGKKARFQKDDFGL